MDQAKVTLVDFFDWEKKYLEDSQAGMESTKTFTSLKETLAKEAKDVRWAFAYDTIINKVGSLLNIGLSDIMAGAWKKYRILLKYCDKKKYGPDETFLVPLAEHTITSTHKPYIEVFVNEQLVGKIDFSVALSLDLKGFVLKVQDRKIKEIQTGTCQGKGEIKCEEFTILEKQTEPCPLPGVIQLGDGVPIIP